MKPGTGTFQRWVATVLVAGTAYLWSGCATLAHRNSYSYPSKPAATACAENGATCPWLVGDALLLLPGVVPGVIAFIVDFSTGAWRHEGYAETTSPTDRVIVAERREFDR